MGESTTKRVGSHYVLDDVLGRGSMGTVWRGHDLNDGSPCAIKILNPTLTTDKGATRRFIDERDIFMSVDDDAVVRVTDMVVESSTFAIVMELVDGPDLAQVLKSLPDHRLDQGTAVSLGIEVCQALAAIHRVGIRHLDIKPANILIEDPENVSGARIPISASPKWSPFMARAKSLVPLITRLLKLQLVGRRRPPTICTHLV